MVTRLSRHIIERIDRLGIVQGRDCISQRSDRDAITLAHRLAELLAQTHAQVAGWHFVIIAHQPG
jgi:hypothetical protein